jgi:small subunit ribosomal protein S19e
MGIVHEVNAQALNAKVAEELKKSMEMPSWTHFVKTGTSRQRPPADEKWFYMRSASILRRLYIDGPVGVQRLRSYYGSSKNLGHQPKHFRRASGKIIRTVLQNLEKMEYVEKVEKPKKGRVLTKKGREFLKKMAQEISQK